ncbi:MAG TPA: hypothetical protein PK546_08855 [Chitinophagales bacterium]|nr:hypothetical protein [Chitinophagales bacterium]
MKIFDLFDKSIKSKLKEILSDSINLGISNEGEVIIEEYINYNELGLSFEHILYELNEKEISINLVFYNKLIEIGKIMNLPEQKSLITLKKNINTN